MNYKKGLPRVLWRYFISLERWWFWCLFVVLLLSYTINIQFAIALNDWNGRFYDALQSVNAEVIYKELMFFIGLASAIIVLLVSASYLKDRLILAVRRDITTEFFHLWLSEKGAHFLLKESGEEPDNPDQRMTEDIKALVSLSMNLFLSFFDSLLTIGSFSIILWNLSGSATVFDITIPGYMFWVCLVYTVISTVITHFIGHRLKRFNFEVQHKEADLRASLIEKRRHAGAIAGAHGEAREVEDLTSKFNDLMVKLIQLVKKQRDLDFFTVGLGQVTHLAPIFFSLPTFLAGGIQLGGLMQIRGAFADVARSLSWIIFAYDDLAKLAATYERLNRLELGLVKSDDIRSQLQKNQTCLESKVTIKGLLNLPILSPLRSQRRLCVDLEAYPGELVVLNGASGVGKSTVLKVASGFYSDFEGQVKTPKNTLWLPQSSYIFSGTLRSNLAYPQSASALNDKEATDLLKTLSLEHLISSLDEVCDWSSTLSGGEQQRVCLGRIFINQPSMVLMDESFSGLDDATATRLLHELKQNLRKTILVLVTHQQALLALADRVYTLKTKEFF